MHHHGSWDNQVSIGTRPRAVQLRNWQWQEILLFAEASRLSLRLWLLFLWYSTHMRIQRKSSQAIKLTTYVCHAPRLRMLSFLNLQGGVPNSVGGSALRQIDCKVIYIHRYWHYSPIDDFEQHTEFVFGKIKEKYVWVKGKFSHWRPCRYIGIFNLWTRYRCGQHHVTATLPLRGNQFPMNCKLHGPQV